MNVKLKPWIRQLRLDTVLLCGTTWLILSGCVQTNLTNPARSATEQLLLSTAADRAVRNVSLIAFDGKKVYLDTAYFESYDAKNAIGTIRDALNSAGARLTTVATNADIIIEARSGALSIDYAQTLIGVPSLGLPVPLAGTLSIPEIDLYKVETQLSRAKLALLAYERASGAHYLSTGPMVGNSYNHYYKLLGFITWTRTDIPEKHKPKRQHQETQPSQK